MKNIKKLIITAALFLMGAAMVKAQEFPRHEVRLGWGDMMYETAVYHNNSTKYNYGYSGHIFAEYQYNFNNWLGVGGQCDWEGVWWNTATSPENFYNLVIMPTVRFTYYRKGIVTMYSGVGLGLNINGGSEVDYKGRQTVCAPAFSITAYGIALNMNKHWFGSVEIGGLNALNGKQEVFMLGSRIFSLSIGYRL